MEYTSFHIDIGLFAQFTIMYCFHTFEDYSPFFSSKYIFLVAEIQTRDIVHCTPSCVNPSETCTELGRHKASKSEDHLLNLLKSNPVNEGFETNLKNCIH